ncbi:hypothetical protein KCP76_17120 [Salmonella enterica subsp. enterica serovar Weltevreden]|nr:hypothetical protein KCP76_17120 [Salmonella enterica subsp. enterica serovar Weltevreden]
MFGSDFRAYRAAGAARTFQLRVIGFVAFRYYKMATVLSGGIFPPLLSAPLTLAHMAAPALRFDIDTLGNPCRCSGPNGSQIRM